MRREVAAGLLVGLLSGLLAGCGGGARVGAAVGSATSAAASVKDCGSFRQTDPGKGPISATGTRCFAAALTAHQLARLVATMLTSEGDPVTTTYEARSDGRARVITDSSRDRFAGGRALTVEICDRLQPFKAGELVFAHCRDEQAPSGTSSASTHT